MKNWFGLDIHPTDTYVSWTIRSKKERQDVALKLRAAYDKIITAGCKNELDILTRAAYDSGVSDEIENNAGDSI